MAGQLSSYSILIADDDHSMRSTLRDIFEPRGFRTFLASNGREAIELIDHHELDCLLLDMHMPDLTGLDILRIVRPRRQTLPAIMLTADNSGAVVDQATALKVFTVLFKPVTRELVTSTVQRALVGSQPGPSDPS